MTFESFGEPPLELIYEVCLDCTDPEFSLRHYFGGTGGVGPIASPGQIKTGVPFACCEDGKELFVVRGASALPANKRAKRIQERILKIATVPNVADVTFEVGDNEFGWEISINGSMIAVKTEADAAHEQKFTRSSR